MTDKDRNELSGRMATMLSNAGILKEGYFDIQRATALIDEFLKENPPEPPEPMEAWKR